MSYRPDRQEISLDFAVAQNHELPDGKACVDWATTECMLREAAAQLRDVLPKRNVSTAE